MKLFNFLKDNAIYILIIIIELIAGYLLIKEGTITTDKNNSGILISIGTSLIATAIVMILDIWRNLSVVGLFKRMNNIIHEAGLQWIYKKRDLDKYDELIESANSSIDVAGFSLSAFFDSYSEIIKEKMTKETLKVRVLFVNPNTPHSENRANIEGRNHQQFKDRITTFINFFREIPRVEIRYIDAPLSTMIFKIDKTMFVGPHFYKIQSKATLTQELKHDHWLFDEYQKEFNRMWADATPAVGE